MVTGSGSCPAVVPREGSICVCVRICIICICSSDPDTFCLHWETAIKQIVIRIGMYLQSRIKAEEAETQAVGREEGLGSNLEWKPGKGFLRK